MTTAQQLEYNLSELDEKIKAGIVGEPIAQMIENLKDQLSRSMEHGDQIWVVKTRHRLTTQRQVVNAVAQGYELIVLPVDRLRAMQLHPIG